MCQPILNHRGAQNQEGNAAADVTDLSGTGDSQRDSRESFAIDTLNFIAHQADSRESLEYLIRANHAT